MVMATLSSVPTLPATATLPAVAALPATATLPAVATLPATATLPAVAALPATATLPDVAALPATATLPDVASLPATATCPCRVAAGHGDAARGGAPTGCGRAVLALHVAPVPVRLVSCCTPTIVAFGGAVQSHPALQGRRDGTGRERSIGRGVGAVAETLAVSGGQRNTSARTCEGV